MCVFIIKKTIVLFRSKGELSLARFFLQMIKILFAKTTQEIQNL